MSPRRPRTTGGGEDPRFLNRDAHPWREEAAQVGLVAPSAPPVAAGAATPAQIAPSPAPGPHAAGIPPAVAATRPQSGPAVLLSEAFETRPLPASLRSASAPVLPFTASQSPAPSAAPAAPHASREGLPFRSITPEPKAAPVPCPSAIPAHLPGAVPAEGPNAPPNKRLIRFDPQTGQPLPFPVWVDVAPPEEERKR